MNMGFCALFTVRVRNVTIQKKKKKNHWAETLADLDLECTWSEMHKNVVNMFAWP
jgi:hypothetical protein